MPKKYKKLIPIVAVVLIALGVNLERFGIDLNQLTGQFSQTTTGQSSSAASSSASSERPTADNATLATTALEHWSSTRPKINQRHVYEGEINRRGKPVGFHARPGGVDPANARVVRVQSGPNNSGIYTASIEIRDGNRWKEKFSSFFPDNMSVNEINEAILYAFKNSDNPKRQPWSGPSGHGFKIQGYTASRGDINTAFPVFVKSQ